MSTGPATTTATRSRIQRLGLPLAVVAMAVPLLFDFGGLSEAGQRELAIFMLAIVLWLTEAVPLYATAVLIIMLQILLVSDQAVWSLPDPEAAPGFRLFFNSLSHPAIILFLGGLFLAGGAAKFTLDRNLARYLLRPFGTSPRMIVLGLMLITAVFSMFMSNTATTAMLLAAVLPVVATMDPDDPLRMGMVLAIPVSANVGGIGTPVGTPPNAIAVGSLADAGLSVSFVKWMALAVPMMVVLLVFAWLVIMRFFPPKSDRVMVRIDATFDRSRPAMVFYAVFAATVVLWLSEPIHGVPSSVVGFLPIVILLLTGIFGPRELQEMPWHVLWLVAGGIALGLGVTTTGLDLWLIDQVGWEAIPTGLIAVVLGLAAIGLSTVISNSAAANLLVPLSLTLALSPAVDIEPVAAGFIIAVAASLAMALPVSTPTNAVAYSTGMIGTGAMAKTGIVIGVVGLALYLFVAPLLWDLMGLSLT